MADISKVYLPGQPCLGFGYGGIDEASLLKFGADYALYAMTKTEPVAGSFAVSGRTLKASLPEVEERECRVKLTANLLRIYNENGGADDFRAFLKAPGKVGVIAAAVPTAAPTPTATATPRPVPFAGTWEVAGIGCIELFDLPGTRYEFTESGQAILDYPLPLLNGGPDSPSLRVIGDHQIGFTRDFVEQVYDWTSDGNTLAFTDPNKQSDLECMLYRPTALTPTYDTLHRAWRAYTWNGGNPRSMELTLRADGSAEIWGDGLDRQSGTYQAQGESLTVLLDSPIQFSADVSTRQLTFVIRELTKNRLTLSHDEAVTRVSGAQPDKNGDGSIGFVSTALGRE